MYSYRPTGSTIGFLLCFCLSPFKRLALQSGDTLQRKATETLGSSLSLRSNLVYPALFWHHCPCFNNSKCRHACFSCGFPWNYDLMCSIVFVRLFLGIGLFVRTLYDKQKRGDSISTSKVYEQQQPKSSHTDHFLPPQEWSQRKGILLGSQNHQIEMHRIPPINIIQTENE